jgi:ParB-like chromosome segregation protein Spo0J
VSNHGIEQRPVLTLADGSTQRNHSGDNFSGIVTIPISMICPPDSPRFLEMDAAHARVLADSEDDLPPILVRRATMRVIDGMHRLTAAQLQGQEQIRVQFFDGDENEAFLLAVESNVRHGMPLTIAERRAAASRILKSHPHMSDRSIAAVSGIAAKTVAAIRSATDTEPHLNARVGRDGRVRPLNRVEGRRLAGQLFAEQPGASLRKIARQAGISLGTARDVRARLQRGESAMLPTRGAAHGAERASSPAPGGAHPARARKARSAETPDVKMALESLIQDPSLRYSETGRSLLRWLSQVAVVDSDLEQVVPKLPPHCAIKVAELARGVAAAWTDLAGILDRNLEDCA